MNTTSDQQRPASGKSAQIRNLLTETAHDGTEVWAIDPKSGPADPAAELASDAAEQRDTRRERKELFGFHPDILREPGPAPRTLPASRVGDQSTQVR
jgi:hypothetical protein